MEPASTSIAAALAGKAGDAAIEVTKEQAKSFIGKMFGPSADAIGELLALRFKEKLFNNIVDTVGRAKRKLDSAGIQPQQVPPKIIHPLLEAASLEHEAPLQDIWANLLANVANPGSNHEFKVSYIHVVKELSRREVLFVQKLFEALTNPGASSAFLHSKRDLTEPDLSRVFSEAGLSLQEPGLKYSVGPRRLSSEEGTNRHNFHEMLDILNRTGMMHMYVVAESVTTPDPSRFVGGRIRSAVKMGVKNNVFYRVSELGWSVIWACQPPKKQE